jgi:hypothetical protein
MIGFPKHLNSRQDYENIVRDFGYCLEVKAAYQALLNTDKHYVFDRELAVGKQPDGPEPEYKVMSEELPDGTVKRVQYRLVDNPNSKLKQLGFTIEEVEEVINHD